jgi:hypothetical protein
MASKQTYPCYVCKRNGFEDVRVYLDGKTEDGKTIYKNEDMSSHKHKTKVPSQLQQQQQQEQPLKSTNIDLVLEIKLLRQKIDHILTLLEERLSSSK